jgi:hypothetical protein
MYIRMNIPPNSSPKNTQVSLVTFDDLKSSKLLDPSEWSKYELPWSNDMFLEEQKMSFGARQYVRVEICTAGLASRFTLTDFPFMDYHLVVNGKPVQTSKIVDNAPCFVFKNVKSTEYLDESKINMDFDRIDSVYIIMPKLFFRSFWSEGPRRYVDIHRPSGDVEKFEINPLTTLSLMFNMDVPLLMVEGLPSCKMEVQIRVRGHIIYRDTLDFRGTGEPVWYLRLRDTYGDIPNLTGVHSFELILDPTCTYRPLGNDIINITAWSMHKYRKDHVFDYTKLPINW